MADAAIGLFPALSLQDPSQDSVILHCISLMSEDDEFSLDNLNNLEGKDRDASCPDAISTASKAHTKDLDSILKLVHNGNVGHWGVQ